MQRLTRAGSVGLVAGLILVGSAQAFVTRPLPLKDLLADNAFICTLRVEKVDPGRPAAVFLLDTDLKGKFPYRRLPVNLTGDKDGKKLNHTAQLLKRLAPRLPLVLFATEDDDQFTVFGYTNGTWFQMIGQKVKGNAPLVWAFTHCEPYLRRTFKGTTEELRQVIVDGLSGKKQPPPHAPNEPPGLGPEVKTAKTGRLPSNPQVAPCGVPAGEGALFAVIPTLGIGGPLAILAVLFPTLFGGVLLLFRRWLAFFTVISFTSLIYCLHVWWLAGAWLGSWWSTPAGLWFALTVVTFAGTVWAWRRHIRTVTGDEVIAEAPQRTEHLVLGVLSVACLGVVVFCLFDAPPLFEPWWDLLLAFSAGIWAGTLYKLYHSLLVGSRTIPASAAGTVAVRPVRPALPTEGVMLWVALFGCVVFAGTRPGGRGSVAGDDLIGGDRPTAKLLADKTWMKVFDGNGLILSSPLVADGKAYLTAARGTTRRFGSLYCVDLQTQKVLWTFSDKKKMKEGYSSPVLADGRLYFGEGFHEDSDCKLYCLDAKTGAKLWAFPTTSHTEATPVVVDGRVYVGAGDDGVYCVDALKGTKIWQFPEGERAKSLRLHVDSTPAVVGKRVYLGGGIDDDTGAGDPHIACVDADTGKEIWVHATPKGMVRKDDPQRQLRSLPAWGSPVAAGKQVFFGLGNGRITIGSKTFEPAGALLCVDAEAGKELWSFKVGDGVLSRATVDRYRVYFGSRDGFCYSLDRQTGKLRWKRSLGSAVVATPVLDVCPDCGRSANLYAIATEGQVCCLDPYTGKVHWSFTDLERQAATLSSTPAVRVTHTPEGDRRRIYFGAALNNMTLQALYCLEDLSPER